MKYATEVRTIRAVLGMTQKELAHDLGVTIRSISRWESKVTKPHPVFLDTLRKMRNDGRRKK